MPRSVSTDGSVIERAGHLEGAIARGTDPADHRKTRRLEWVGAASPFDEPVVQYRMVTGQYTPTMVKALKQVAVRANVRAGGNRNRLLEHDHPAALAPVPGLTKTYHWTAANGYVQEVAFADADLILSHPAIAHEFVDLDERAALHERASREWDAEFVATREAADVGAA